MSGKIFSSALASAIAVAGAVVSMSEAEAVELARAKVAQPSSNVTFSGAARAQLRNKSDMVLERTMPDDPDPWDNQFLNQNLSSTKKFNDRVLEPRNVSKTFRNYLKP